MYNSANFAGPSKGALHTQLVIMLKHWVFFFIKNEYYSVQVRLFFYFLWSKGQNFFSNFGWPDYLFYLQNCQTPHPLRNQMVVPKINQEINEPSYEMVGVKITVTNYGQNNRIFGLFFLVDFLLFFSDIELQMFSL